mmetsp:Transcript_20644/g.43399  ORF Transcript_20644/g.43399 Transcript_20644/m.43399 type:complete len:414 (+) Transcript_20644:304-1545(+)
MGTFHADAERGSHRSVGVVRDIDPSRTSSRSGGRRVIGQRFVGRMSRTHRQRCQRWRRRPREGSKPDVLAIRLRGQSHHGRIMRVGPRCESHAALATQRRRERRGMRCVGAIEAKARRGPHRARARDGRFVVGGRRHRVAPRGNVRGTRLENLQNVSTSDIARQIGQGKVPGEECWLVRGGGGRARDGHRERIVQLFYHAFEAIASYRGGNTSCGRTGRGGGERHVRGGSRSHRGLGHPPAAARGSRIGIHSPQSGEGSTSQETTTDRLRLRRAFHAGGIVERFVGREGMEGVPPLWSGRRRCAECACEERGVRFQKRALPAARRWHVEPRMPPLELQPRCDDGGRRAHGISPRGLNGRAVRGAGRSIDPRRRAHREGRCREHARLRREDRSGSLPANSGCGVVGSVRGTLSR